MRCASALPLTLGLRVATSPLMSDGAPDSLIPYDEIVQEALRAVVGRVLGQIQMGGSELPGAHHFYITFKTSAPGVDIPTHLKERFPDEMTIVLQNKFWDLDVTEIGFSVGLSFNQMPSKLVVTSVSKLVTRLTKKRTCARSSPPRKYERTRPRRLFALPT